MATNVQFSEVQPGEEFRGPATGNTLVKLERGGAVIIALGPKNRKGDVGKRVTLKDTAGCVVEFHDDGSVDPF